jgi:hypothetical protein
VFFKPKLAIIITLLTLVTLCTWLYTSLYIGKENLQSVADFYREEKINKNSSAVSPPENLAEPGGKVGKAMSQETSKGIPDDKKVDENMSIPKHPWLVGKDETGAKDMESPQLSTKEMEILQEKSREVLKKELAVGDYVKIAKIVLGKLKLNEIKFLFDSMKNDLFINASLVELERIRGIIFTKLSTEDIASLRAIGNKYGKEMKILDPDINVTEEKARRMKLKVKK